MKTLYFAILFSLIFNICKSQKYEHFIKETKQWKYATPLVIPTKSSHDNYPFFSLNINYFQGDTIIKNIKYCKSYVKRVMPKSTDTTITFSNFIYEDTINKRVYMLEPFLKDKNVLLYDFSLNEGDNVSTYIIGDIYYHGKVMKTDSIFLIDKFLKRITFEDGLEWIEGIGSTSSVWYPYDGILICVKENSNVLYLDTALFQNCDTIFNELPPSIIRYNDLNQTNKVSIYPNPIDRHSILKIESRETGFLNLIIYNSFGEQIISDTFISDYPIGQINLKEGIYFIRILYKGEQIGFNKLIITDK